MGTWCRWEHEGLCVKRGATGGGGTGAGGGVVRVGRVCGKRRRRARGGGACQRPERCSGRRLTTCGAPGALQRRPAPLVRAWSTLLPALSTAPEPRGTCRATKAG
jgi:hypothetical protein